MSAKATELYHFGKMGGIADINTSIRNLYCLMNTIIVIDGVHLPTVWNEIVEFDGHENHRRPPLV